LTGALEMPAPLRLLFIHNNFPGQFIHLLRHLRRSRDVSLTFISGENQNRMRGIRLLAYRQPNGEHLSSMRERGLAVYRIIARLLEQGERFDAVLAHLPFGDALYLRSVLPDTPFLALPEFYLSRHDNIFAFLGEDALGAGSERSRLGGVESSLVTAKGVLDADLSIVPTEFQRNQFPSALEPHIAVLHEGIDDALYAPGDEVPELATPGRTFGRQEEVVTFATRSLEPLRGYHVFLRAAQLLAARRARTVFLVAGSEQYSYSGRPPEGENWRRFLEARIPLPPDRLFFLGLLDRPRHSALLRISAAHVYLTAPFVLSWSLLEAMAQGAAIVASDTAPVREFIAHGVSGLLTDFFDAEALADRIEDVLDRRLDVEALRNGARGAVEHLRASRCARLWCEKLASILPAEQAATLLALD
jgi:glycosyltransferase involved in cell wall biosynthesis